MIAIWPVHLFGVVLFPGLLRPSYIPMYQRPILIDLIRLLLLPYDNITVISKPFPPRKRKYFQLCFVMISLIKSLDIA